MADSGNNRIRRVSSEGHVTWIAGSGLAGFSNDKLLRAEFNRPQGIVITPTGLIFVADTLNHRIRLVSLHEEYEGRVKYMENMVRRVTTEVVMKQLEARAVADVLAQLAREGKRPKRKRNLKTLGTEKNKMK